MTIRLRLTIYWAAVLAAILLVAAFAAIELFARQQWSAMDAALLEEAENTSDQIQRGGNSSAPGEPPSRSRQYSSCRCSSAPCSQPRCHNV